MIVTEDGYGKRVAVGEVRRTQGRGTVGVRVSRDPIAAALVVNGEGAGDVVIVSAAGKVERVALASIPVRRRSDPSSGRVSKGARVMRLAAGDVVATVAVATEDESASGTWVGTRPPAIPPRMWPGGRVGLRDGENVRSVVYFGPLKDLAEIERGGSPAVGREEWARSDVHKASSYWCVHCGTEHPGPERVYACVDAHADDADAGWLKRSQPGRRRRAH